MRFLSLSDLNRLLKRRRLSRKGFSGTKKVRHKGAVAGPDKQPARTVRVLPILMAVVLWIVSTANVVYTPASSTHHYLEGQVARRFFYSEVEFDDEDLAQTRLKREQAASLIPPVYRIDNDLVERSDRHLASLRTAIVNRLTEQGGATPGSGSGAVLPGAGAAQAVQALARDQLRALGDLVSQPGRWTFLEEQVRAVSQRAIASDRAKESFFEGTAVDGRIYIMDSLLRQTQVDVTGLLSPRAAAEQVAREVARQLPAGARATEAVLLMVLPEVFTPNVTFDDGATQKAKAVAGERIPIIRRKIRVGDPLIERGQTITEMDLARLRKHQVHLAAQQTQTTDLRGLLLFGTLSLLLALLAIYALIQFRPTVARDNTQVVLVVLVMVLQMVLVRGVADLYANYWSSTYVLYMLLPFSLGAILLSQLIGVRVALIGAAYIAIVMCLQQKHAAPIAALVVALLSGSVAAGLMRRARRRYHVLRAGIGAGVAAFLACAIFVLDADVASDVLRRLLPQMLLLAIAGGVITSIVGAAILPLFEFAFGVTTDMSLLELSDLNHPLLKRLQLEAPGTYHHSLMVASLAEQAAEAIGANPLLARVCAYFHDIGKLEHPDYFAENMWERDPHRDLQPRMSSLVILNHVKEGLDLAIRYKLKKPLREAIAQHHGTSLVYYFYRRALAMHDRGKKSDDGDIGEHEYRYPGPLPARKEILIISIADACEAAARSLEKPTPQKLAAIVNEILMNRIRDGQFDQADLTFEELTVVKETITKSLGTMFHGRVKYPEEKTDDETDLFQAAEKARAQAEASAVESDAARRADD